MSGEKRLVSAVALLLEYRIRRRGQASRPLACRDVEAKNETFTMFWIPALQDRRLALSTISIHRPLEK